MVWIVAKHIVSWTILLVVIPTLTTAGESTEQRPTISATATDKPSIFLLIADDLGTDWAPCYGLKGVMPFLDSMCDKAAVFDNAYAEPLCTPTRSSMLTSRYPFRTGAGNARQLAGQVRLALDEPSIPKIARQAGISD